MQVNYVREHERFIEYAADERLTPNEQLLWYALMHIFNQRAEGNDWPDGFIRITNDRLFTYLPIKWDAMAKARNALKQRGLIDFRSGNRNKVAPEYKMIWFYPACYPFKTDNAGGNPRGNTGGNPRGNTGGSEGGFINKHNSNGNINKKLMDEDDDEDVDIRAREEDDPIEGRAERAAGIRAGFAAAFGRMAYPAEVERLTVASWQMNFDVEMVIRAMAKAAGGGAKNPVDYTLQILENWRNEGVMQPHQVDEYLVEFNRQRGRSGLFSSGDVVEDYCATEEARRRRREENLQAGIL